MSDSWHARGGPDGPPLTRTSWHEVDAARAHLDALRQRYLDERGWVLLPGSSPHWWAHPETGDCLIEAAAVIRARHLDRREMNDDQPGE